MTSIFPPINRVYSVHLEITYDFGRLLKRITTVVAAPSEEEALAKAKLRYDIFGEVTDFRVIEQPGARW